jgi:hypothetical protein
MNGRSVSVGDALYALVEYAILALEKNPAQPDVQGALTLLRTILDRLHERDQTDVSSRVTGRFLRDLVPRAQRVLITPLRGPNGRAPYPREVRVDVTALDGVTLQGRREDVAEALCMALQQLLAHLKNTERLRAHQRPRVFA